MIAQVRKHLHHCVVGEQVVFLDLAADRYFLASPRLGKAFLDWAAAPSNQPADILFDCGIIDVRSEPVSNASRSSTANSSMLDDPRMRPSLGKIARAVRFQLSTDLALRTRPLHQVVASITQRKAHLSSSPLPITEIAPDISGFRASEMLFTSDRKCLRRSLALAALLSNRRFLVDVVFGVRLRPFEAHCWVQRGPVLVNDRVEDVRLYTPILT